MSRPDLDNIAKLAVPPNTISPSLKRDLNWLETRHFIRLSWALRCHVAFIRVYIIPEDLEGPLKASLFQRHQDLAEGTKRLRNVLSNIIRCPTAWEGLPSSSTDSFFSQCEADRTLPVVYQNLPSPPSLETSFGPYHTPESPSPVALALDEYKHDLVSQLHDYQKRSLARILNLELAVDPDDGQFQTPKETSPLFLPIDSLGTAASFHIDPVRLIVRKTPPSYSPARGGILCEEMGTGKTVICIALILSTLDQLPRPENDDRKIRTEWSLADEEARDPDPEVRLEGSVPSLFDLTCNFIRTNPEASGWYRQRHSGLPEILTAKLNHPSFRPFYHSRPSVANVQERSRSFFAPAGQSVKIWLTNATLLLVPKMLLPQWRAELNKHVRHGSLKALIIDDLTIIPPASDLANTYDLVVITHERLTVDVTRRAKLPDSELVFSQIRWLRLIVDEGNVCANLSETMMHTRNISAERRWIVSGTPTTNLVNVGSVAPSVVSLTEDGEDSSGDGDSSNDSGPGDGAGMAQYRSDLKKLSIMISGFLAQAVSPMIGGFHELQSVRHREETLFQAHVVAPACATSPAMKWGSGRILERILSRCMVRHRIEEIESEVVLPPLTSAPVLLSMTPYQAVTYNVLQSYIVVNAIDSERTDKDYFFHPLNARSLAELVRNLSQACFWHANREAFDMQIDQFVKTSKDSIGRATRRGMEKCDIELVTKAHEWQVAAASNHVWRAMMRHLHMPIRIHDLPLDLQAAWNLLMVSTPSGPASSLPIQQPPNGAADFYTIHVTSLRQAGCDCMLDEEALKLKGNRRKKAVLQQSCAELEVLEALAEKATKKQKAAENGANNDDGPRHAAASTPALLQDTKKSSGKKNGRGGKGKKSPDEEVAAKLRPEVRILSGLAENQRPGADTLPAWSTPLDHPLLGVKIKGSASPKINFMVKEILRCPEDRFLIFSDSFLSLSYTKEAFDAFRIRSSILQDRSELNILQEFETNVEQRALLLELKHGARGLNLTSANRVIFIEPVWQPDIESQAIKRAHRIGQQRPVTVQTLVMKGTAEEEMLSRRAKFGRTHKLMQNDVVMREFVANPRFIDPALLPCEDGDTELNVPLFVVEGASGDALTDGPGPTAPSLRGALKRRAGGDEGPELGESSRPKKRVAFAGDDLPRVRLVVSAPMEVDGAKPAKKERRDKARTPKVKDDMGGQMFVFRL
ncbi:hypothetical protein FRC01_000737 [Tulasnella sp. 417]|nr:hypothetical protein FRC01_000737 [Tulasnella sp. 417]